jgi:tetratricopeptide (TPR) repeat protein
VKPAVRYYDDALELGVDPGDLPGLLFRLGAALHAGSDPRRIDVLDRARDELTSAGDPETAAEASMLLGEAWWFDGHAERAREQLTRARDLVRDRPDSPAAARVMARSARAAMLAGNQAEALELGREALRMAEELGLEDLVPYALIDIGGARHYTGDTGGVADMERAIEIAMRSSNPVAARGYNNLAAALSDDGDIEGAERLWREGRRVAERFGNRTIGRFIEGQLFWIAFETGRWDEALDAAQAFIEECEAGSPHYLHSSALFVRAYIGLARGNRAAALTDAEQSLALARQAGDPQQVLPALSLKVRVLVELGRLDEARGIAFEMFELARNRGPVRPIQLALVAEPLAIVPELRDLLATRPAGTFADIARRIVDGDLLTAAADLDAAGSHAYAADVRLLAARKLAEGGNAGDADEQVRRALTFYRSVGASAYVREAEQLLSATA